MFAIVTRWVRDNGRVIRHVYFDENDKPYPTRAKALTGVRRMLKSNGKYHGVDVIAADMKSGRLEVNVVKICLRES